MYQVGLGGLGGRQQNYAYGLADFKIKEYMGTVTQADIDLINTLQVGAAKSRARSKRKGIGGLAKRVSRTLSRLLYRSRLWARRVCFSVF